MEHSFVFVASVIITCALVTWFLRALPFLVFGGRDLPPVINYLGKVLPPAIMMVLVVFCLKGTDFTTWPYGLTEVLSCLFIIAVHLSIKNMYLSIVAGTICYMLLIRLPIFM